MRDSALTEVTLDELAWRSSASRLDRDPTILNRYPDFTMVVLTSPPLRKDPLQVLHHSIIDLRALERYILEVLEVQQHERSLQAHHDAARLVQHLIELLRAHVARLDTHLLVMRERAPVNFHDGSRSVAGVFVGFVGKMRSHEASHMLRDDYTLLSLAAMGYTMLHAAGLALEETPTAQIALDHLRELHALSREIAHAMPGVIVGELSVSLDHVRRAAGEDALANLQGIHGNGRHRRESMVPSFDSRPPMPSLAKA